MLSFTTPSPSAHAGFEVTRRAGPLARNATRKRAFSAGFTLVELLLSVTMAVILMLGISQVFRSTTEAVGVGQVLSGAIRDGRAAQPVFAQDMTSVVRDGSPFMMLRSSRQWAFRSQTDMLADRDWTPGTMSAGVPKGIDTIDIDGNNTEGETTVLGEQIMPADVNSRSHRTDVFSFFCRGLFPRQTGNDGTFIDDQSSAEAYVWYGHLMLPNNEAVPTYQDLGPNPTGSLTVSGGGSLSNPNNFYATQWCLGRVATLLRDKDPDTNAGSIADSAGIAQDFWDRTWTRDKSSTAAFDMTPLGNKSQNPTKTYYLYDSRYDIAATSISSYRQRMLDMMSSPGFSVTNTTWWTLFMYGGQSSTLLTRFHASPFITRPVDAKQMAQASPIFVRSCTQFIVEYAGDFLTQINDPAAGANYGKLTATGGNQPDGTIDFYVDPTTQAKRIRWYGFPRNTSGQAGIKPGNGDVVPLRDILSSAMYSAYPFEKMTNTLDSHFLPIAADYLAANAVKSDSDYLCAWGPNDVKPKMIRITMTVDDPGGRLGDGKTFEYVYTLP